MWWILYIGCIASPPAQWWIDYQLARRRGYPDRHARRHAWSNARISVSVNALALGIMAYIQLFG